MANWSEKTTSKGVLKYRMPNILEAYDILDASGVSGSHKVSPVTLKRNVIQSMQPIVDFSAIEGASKYEDLFDMVDDMIAPLGEIADEVIIKTFDAFKKKTS